MVTITRTIEDPSGLHARPAAQLAKEAANWSCQISILSHGSSAPATDLVALMGLDVREGEKVTVTFDGPDEDEAKVALEPLVQNL